MRSHTEIADEVGVIAADGMERLNGSHWYCQHVMKNKYVLEQAFQAFDVTELQKNLIHFFTSNHQDRHERFHQAMSTLYSYISENIHKRGLENNISIEDGVIFLVTSCLELGQTRRLVTLDRLLKWQWKSGIETDHPWTEGFYNTVFSALCKHFFLADKPLSHSSNLRSRQAIKQIKEDPNGYTALPDLFGFYIQVECLARLAGRSVDAEHITFELFEGWRKVLPQKNISNVEYEAIYGSLVIYSCDRYGAGSLITMMIVQALGSLLESVKLNQLPMTNQSAKLLVNRLCGIGTLFEAGKDELTRTAAENLGRIFNDCQIPGAMSLFVSLLRTPSELYVQQSQEFISKTLPRFFKQRLLPWINESMKKNISDYNQLSPAQQSKVEAHLFCAFLVSANMAMQLLAFNLCSDRTYKKQFYTTSEFLQKFVEQKVDFISGLLRNNPEIVDEIGRLYHQHSDALNQKIKTFSEIGDKSAIEIFEGGPITLSGFYSMVYQLIEQLPESENKSKLMLVLEKFFVDVALLPPDALPIVPLQLMLMLAPLLTDFPSLYGDIIRLGFSHSMNLNHVNHGDFVVCPMTVDLDYPELLPTSRSIIKLQESELSTIGQYAHSRRLLAKTLTQDLGKILSCDPVNFNLASDILYAIKKSSGDFPVQANSINNPPFKHHGVNKADFTRQLHKHIIAMDFKSLCQFVLRLAPVFSSSHIDLNIAKLIQTTFIKKSLVEMGQCRKPEHANAIFSTAVEVLSEDNVAQLLQINGATREKISNALMAQCHTLNHADRYTVFSPAQRSVNTTESESEHDKQGTSRCSIM